MTMSMWAATARIMMMMFATMIVASFAACSTTTTTATATLPVSPRKIMVGFTTSYNNNNIRQRQRQQGRTSIQGTFLRSTTDASAVDTTTTTTTTGTPAFLNKAFNSNDDTVGDSKKQVGVAPARSPASNRIGLGLSSQQSASFLSSYQPSIPTECDDINRPPSLNILLRSLQQLTTQGNDIRGTFVDHRSTGGSITAVAHAILKQQSGGNKPEGKASHPPLTPFAAHCLGYAYAQSLVQQKIAHDQQQQQQQQQECDSNSNNIVHIVIGHDPRSHGMRLVDAFARGAESYTTVQLQQQQQLAAAAAAAAADDFDVRGDDDDSSSSNEASSLNKKPSAASAANPVLPRVVVSYAGICTTPACAAFCTTQWAASASATATTTDPLHAHVDGAVMVTASHLPADRNGFKLFSRFNYLQTASVLYTKEQIQSLGLAAADHCANYWFRSDTNAASSTAAGGMLSLPAASGKNAVLCSGGYQLDYYMPAYANTLKRAVLQQVLGNDSDNMDENNAKPLQGLKIVLNAGNGSGGFFAKVLQELGADTTGSLGCQPDATFPAGIPNPEYAPMFQATVQQCQAVSADLGIMLDTDADRCGFVVPTTASTSSSSSESSPSYEPLHRNRLIALLAVMFSQSHPGSAIVTDSVTSEGLTSFLQDTLKLQHVRYLKGYANVINKAIELTRTGMANAVMGIETSGHCAMQENDYLDDGTYTAVKIISLLAKENNKKQQQEQQAQLGNDAGSKSSKRGSILLDLIAECREMEEVAELRMTVTDGQLETMQEIFDFCALEMERLIDVVHNNCRPAAVQEDETANNNNEDDDDDVDLCPLEDPSAIYAWQVDRDNLEGIRIRLGTTGQFFMLRKSLHDPIISLQIEANSREEARNTIVQPLLSLLQAQEHIRNSLIMDVLEKY